MFSFTTHFFDNQIFIKDKFAYNNNQLLTEILNLDLDLDDLHSHQHKLFNLFDSLEIRKDCYDYFYEDYHQTVVSVQETMTDIDNIFKQISISELTYSINQIHSTKLYNLLNKYSFLWKTLDDEDFKDGYDEFDYFYNFCDRTIVVEYTPTDFKSNLDDPEYAHCIEEMNIEIDKLCKSYLAFVDDLLRVKYLYADFLDNYLNVDIKFLDNDTLASNFMEFMKKNPLSRFENFRNFTSGYSQFYHTAISVDGKSILCESYDFQSLGAFLYFDLFRGIRNNYQPKKCESCGKYFLLTSGKYTLFCENISTIDSTKTCREIGSRKKYSEKCKLDPIWKTYKNAYTSHYARYMRNKMTTSEFERWSAWAIDWRDKAERDEITFDEYVKEIKK